MEAFNAINPFSDPEFKKKILEKEKNRGDDYEVLGEFKEIIANAPKIPASTSIKNVILDSSTLARNEKEAKAKEMSMALNKVFTDYNKEYNTDLQIDFSNLSNTLVNVSDPKTRHVLELYLSEVFKSIRPVLILHMIQKLTLAIDYVLDPVRMFDTNNLSIPDLFLVIEKIMDYINVLNNMKKEVEIKGSDLELRKLADENNNNVLDDPDSKKAVDDFMKLLRGESGIE